MPFSLVTFLYHTQVFVFVFTFEVLTILTTVSALALPLQQTTNGQGSNRGPSLNTHPMCVSFSCSHPCTPSVDSVTPPPTIDVLHGTGMVTRQFYTINSIRKLWCD